MSSICFDCKKATPILCAWINSGDKTGITLNDKSYAVECERYKRGSLPPTKLDSGQALKLAGMIVVKAGKDLERLHKTILKIRSSCAEGDLFDCIEGLQEKQRTPFMNDKDKTALDFFTGKSKFADELLDYCELHVLPKEITDIVNDIISYEKHCKQCVMKCKRAMAQKKAI